MAQRRMFNISIIDSDTFIDMPSSARLLYYDLSMRADDDGFINNPRKIVRMTGASEDDLKVLTTKQFIIPFDSGIVVIRHWKIHNYIQKDRYHETQYKDEKASLILDENEMYTKCIQDVYKMDTQDRLGKDRIGKVSLGKDNILSTSGEVDEASSNKIDYNFFLETYNTYCVDMPKLREMTDKRKKQLKIFSKRYSEEDFKQICNLANKSDFLSGRSGKWTNCNFDWIISSDHPTKILEGTYNNKKAKGGLDILQEIYQEEANKIKESEDDFNIW